MMQYSEREIKEGLLWVRLASGSEVYGEALTIVEKKQDNDACGITQLYARFESGGPEHRITKWGWQ